MALEPGRMLGSYQGDRPHRRGRDDGGGWLINMLSGDHEQILADTSDLLE